MFFALSKYCSNKIKIINYKLYCILNNHKESNFCRQKQTFIRSEEVTLDHVAVGVSVRDLANLRPRCVCLKPIIGVILYDITSLQLSLHIPPFSQQLPHCFEKQENYH